MDEQGKDRDILATLTISLNLYVDQIKWLKKKAIIEDRSVSSVVRRILDKVMSGDE